MTLKELGEPQGDRLDVLLDQHGDPVARRPSLRERWGQASRRTRVLVLGAIPLVAAVLTIVVYSQQIWSWFPRSARPAYVPPVVLKISNRTPVSHRVLTRGDFFVWLPGTDGYHYVGKYELRNTQWEPLIHGVVEIAPNST